MFFNIRHLPLQQEQFRAEGGGAWMVGQEVLHHCKDGGGGEIAGLGCFRRLRCEQLFPFLSKDLHCAGCLAVKK
jgi:hypothetical protein